MRLRDVGTVTLHFVSKQRSVGESFAQCVNSSVQVTTPHAPETSIPSKWLQRVADWCVPASALRWGRLTRPWDHGMDITAFLTHDSFRGWDA